ncbi:hypothetical protein MSKU15_0002 [Komagataeibacter diospyri]|uniref:hypothetical protein n=1 Tax=Komagataeibacter diospyri TaxID=1932662 RepID=UPI00113E666C|nr:hypothetical protein [Komagataeibacter diospyri]GCE88401.1 hypothetical protein MSKU15_0002 [Komagataeibacter diospyri]
MTMGPAIFHVSTPSGRVGRAMATGGLCLAAVCVGPFADARATENVSPSPVEQQIITQRITALPARERPGIMGQDMAWQMTTFLCQDVARSVLVRRGALPHRFFLQDDRPGSQVVLSPALIEGRGQYMPATGPMRWVAFTWACHLDPATGHVVHFDVNPAARQRRGP